MAHAHLEFILIKIETRIKKQVFNYIKKNSIILTDLLKVALL